jgi:hypothetical protein
LSDALLVRAARLAGINALVMDLPNLFPVAGLKVDVMVAPSHFVAAHASVAAAGQYFQKGSKN